MGIKTSRLDVSEHLRDDEDIKVFLEEAAKKWSRYEFIHALSTVARAKGMTQIAKEAGISRESLYNSLSKENLQPEMINKIVGALSRNLPVTEQA